MLIRLKEQKTAVALMLTVLLMNHVLTLSAFPAFQILSYLLLFLCLLGFAFMACVCLCRPRMTRLDVWMTLFFGLFMLITVMCKGYVKSTVYQSCQVFLLLMLFNYYRDHIVFMIKVCAVIFSVMIYFNHVLMIIFPDWMYAAKDMFYGYLLGGNYNQMGCRMLCGIITNILCVRFSKKWLVNVVALSLTCLYTLLIVTSMTSLTCITLFLLFCLVPSRALRKAGMITCFVVYVFLQITLVFGGQGLYNNEYVSYFVEVVLGKNLSFTHRTEMWAAAGRLYAESPYLGYGFADNEWYLTHMSTLARGPHNFVYSLLIYGGIALLTVFIMTCASVLRKVSALRWDYYCTMLIMGVEIWLFMGLMEVYPLFFIMYLLVLLYYYPDLCENEERRAADAAKMRDMNKEERRLADGGQ